MIARVPLGCARRAGAVVCGPVSWTSPFIAAARAAAVAVLLGACATEPPEPREPLPGRFAEGEMVVGLEYAVVDNAGLAVGMAQHYAGTGLTGMKLLGEASAWGRMQSAPDAPIDFADLDLFVRSYQDAGFTVLTVALKPHSRWASKDVGLLGAENASPKAEYRALFAEWVTRVVERYDGDGIEDMPGLRWPVALFEIGSEFSSYQPEPVADYLATLEIAYRAAHRANPGVRVAHAAFLTTPVDLDVADPAGYEAAWARTPRHDLHHGLADQRAVLDRPEIFDVINLHNLGAPAELEHQLRWLAHETGRRGYRKPVIVSDTIPTSYIAWGPATDCTGGAQGVLIPPAKEQDRCRLAAFFRKLVDGDPATLAWTRGFVAADHVQRTVIAAEQGVELINLSFTFDLPLLTWRLAQAGAGISAWGGGAKFAMRSGQVLESYPLSHAIGQMMGHLEGVTRVERVALPDHAHRIYKLIRPAGPLWVAWLDRDRVLLPEDGSPSSQAALNLQAPAVLVEPVITEIGRGRPRQSRRQTQGGRLTVELSHTPVYILPLE